MSAKQGERYKIVAPKRQKRTVIGQGTPPNHYKATVFVEGRPIVVTDVFGDVVTASENVPYPTGKAYRHVRWIDEHPERFKKLD